MGTPLESSRDAQLCPYGIITTNRKNPVFSRVSKDFSLIFDPFPTQKSSRVNCRTVGGVSLTTNELSDRITAAETRMAEISVLRSHIINYAKTREDYVGYRKAGYSKKYLAEHEPDILLHKAAKKYFDEVGIQKLPSVKSLNNEYSELIAKKKEALQTLHKNTKNSSISLISPNNKKVHN